jgi:glycyl-tRNA synthetase beta chain
VSPSAKLPLLVEVGCEEIPARFLEEAQNSFARNLEAALREARLIPQSAPPVESYSTPRRLLARAPEVLDKQLDAEEGILGPPVRVGLDKDGKPTRAAESFAEKNSVKVKDLVKVTTPRGEYLSLKKTTRGQPALELLPAILTGAVTSLSFPKSMYWVAKAGPRFVRPIRWLLALLGEGKQACVVAFEIAGVKSGNQTYGNRTVGKNAIVVQGFEDYSKKLRTAQVEFIPEQRLEWMMYEVKELLEGLPLTVVEDKWLEKWSVNSTEWPKPLLGQFDERFLRLPREVLVMVMRDHQKYFAVEDEKGKLQPRFVALLNRADDPKGLIRQGHERVLAARFTDAEFFWDADQRVPLRDRRKSLEKVTYEAELGSYGEKIRRMWALASVICRLLEAAGKVTPEETKHVQAAVELCKCDLNTQMVQEFPELQGIVGGLYARAQGEKAEVADAIYDHYLPVGFEDRVPRSVVGAVVSLADKLDSVAGGFAVGHEPTGSSDPFALRRRGNGVIKVLLELSLSITLREVSQEAINVLDIQWQKPQGEVFASLTEFFEERLRFAMETGYGLRFDTVRAVLAAGWTSPLGALQRAQALERIRGGENFAALSLAAKRIKNILAKSATSSDWQPGEADENVLEAGPERALYEAFRSVEPEAGELADSGDYEGALEAIAKLRPAVDDFFDHVLVMAEDRSVRQNRLRLLGKLDQLFSGIAQFAEIAGGTADVDASTSTGDTGRD